MGLTGMRYAVADGLFDGESSLILTDEAAGLSATILPGVGSNLLALDRPGAGLEYIYGPSTLAELKDRPTRYGNPVLLPPNRIREGRFTFAGRTYNLPLNRPPHHLHGLVHSLAWRVEGQGAGEAEGAWVRTVMEAREHESFRAVFPQDLRLALTFTLRDGRLGLTAEALNRGPEPFPFGLGYHTYFRVPMRSGEKAGDYRVTLPAGKRWELEECYPTGRILPLAPAERLQSTPVAELRLDDVYTDLAPGEPEIRSRLWHEPSGRGIEFASDRQFPHWVAWSGPEPGAPFLCLEPYSWVTNAPNLALRPETTGLAALGEGETWRGRIEFRPF